MAWYYTEAEPLSVDGMERKIAALNSAVLSTLAGEGGMPGAPSADSSAGAVTRQRFLRQIHERIRPASLNSTGLMLLTLI